MHFRSLSLIALITLFYANAALADLNKINTDQSGADIELNVVQNGTSQYAGILQVGSKLKGSVTQSVSGNKAYITQGSAAGLDSFGLIPVPGTENTIKDQTATIVQAGTENTGSVLQYSLYAPAKGALAQTGDRNLASISQDTGSDVNASQEGNSNTMVSELASGAPQNNLNTQQLKQKGNSNKLNSYSVAPTNSTMSATQTGNNNTANITARGFYISLSDGPYSVGNANNAISMTQEGNQNTSTTSIDYSVGSVASTKQQGNNNTLKVQHYFTTATTTNVLQNGDYNSVDSYQDGAISNVQVSQTGDHHVANLKQSGGTNTTIQEGSANSIDSQSGNNKLSYSQKGIQNKITTDAHLASNSQITITQTVGNNTADAHLASNSQIAITQMGGNNTATATQSNDYAWFTTGKNSLAITQVGDRNTSSVNQTGAYQTANLSVTGSDNLVTVSQKGGGTFPLYANNADIAITGNTNTVALAQDGYANTAKMTINASASSYDVSQTGAINTLTMKSSGTGINNHISQH